MIPLPNLSVATKSGADGNRGGSISLSNLINEGVVSTGSGSPNGGGNWLWLALGAAVALAIKK